MSRGFSGIWHLKKNIFLLIYWNRSNSWHIRASFINGTGWPHQYTLMFSNVPSKPPWPPAIHWCCALKHANNSLQYGAKLMESSSKFIYFRVIYCPWEVKLQTLKHNISSENYIFIYLFIYLIYTVWESHTGSRGWTHDDRTFILWWSLL